MGARRINGKYDDDDDEREKLLHTIPPGGTSTRDVHGSESGILEPPHVYKSRWRSIRVMYLTMFLSSVSFSICMSSLYPYLKVLDRSATTDFLGWVVAAYSLGQLIASPFFGAWSNCRLKSREPIVVSLTINVLANVLYMYLESISHHKAAWLVVARAFVGFGAGNVAVVRSYVSGATTMRERTPAMANMSACQAIGFIIGPVIQTAMVPIGFPGPIHTVGFHLDLYTATALLSAVVGIINIVLLIVVFKEHRVPDEDLIPSIQGSGRDSVDEISDTPLDYLAVISSILLFFSILFIFSVFETISTPLSMHMFAWSKSKATLFIGVMLGCAGVVSIVVFVFIKILSKRFNERYLLFGGFLICLFGFIIYLPWGSHYPEIQYADYTPASTVPTNATYSSTAYTSLTPEYSSSPHTSVLSRSEFASYAVIPMVNPNKETDKEFKEIFSTNLFNSVPQSNPYVNNEERSGHSVSGELVQNISLKRLKDNDIALVSGSPVSTLHTETRTSPTHGLNTHRTPTKPLTHQDSTTATDNTLKTTKGSSVSATEKSTTTKQTTEQSLSTSATKHTTETSSRITREHTTYTSGETTHTNTTAAQSSSSPTTEQTTRKEPTTNRETTESSSGTTKKQTTIHETTMTSQSASSQSQTTLETTPMTGLSSEQTTAEIITTEPPYITTAGPPTENTTKEAVGCPYYYNWCFNTPSILLWQFLLGTLFVAVGYPTCNVMSYAIYSKILGPKPQGIWMGWLTAAGSLARCLGPVFVSQVYDAYGPRVTFISMCVLIVLTLIGFLLVCRRLVPFKSLTITV